MEKPPSCVGCPYYDRPMVWGEGNPNAQIVFIGQNPGPSEIEAGRPFVGGSGQVLNRGLERALVSRERQFVTNTVKCFVAPGTPVDARAVKQCRPLLDKELSALRGPKVIVTLGKEAFDELTGKELSLVHNRKAMEKNPRAWLRGCPYVLPSGIIVYPTVHPAFVMRSGFAVGPTFDADLVRARRLAEGTVKLPEEHFTDNPSNQEVVEYAEEFIRVGEGALDIETPETGMQEDERDPLAPSPINSIGLSNGIGSSLEVHPDQFALLKTLLDGVKGLSRPTCWVYNAEFDGHHLSKQFTLEGVVLTDALKAFHLLWPDSKEKGLATCFSYYAYVPYHKNLRHSNPSLYSCRDTYGTLWAGQQMVLEMARLGSMLKLFREHQPLWRTLSDWRVKGTRIDTGKADETAIMLYSALEQYEKWWSENIPDFSWSSVKDLGQLFVEVLHLPEKKKLRPKTGKRTRCMDDEVLEFYADKHGNKTAQLVRLMRQLRHTGDYVTMAGPDGRIHPRFKYHGQVGGRIQAVGDNVQTIPEEIGGVYPRNIVRADTDEQIVFAADYSQIEFRLYAIQSGDKKLIEAVTSGDYVYGFFHEWIWEEPFFQQGKPHQKRYIRDDLPPWKLLVTKSWPLGFIYGRGVPDTTGLPIGKSKAQEIYSKFHRDYPSVGQFHSNILLKAARQEFLQTVFGRMRRFPNVKQNRNEILAFPGQSTAVDVLIRNAILALPNRLEAIDPGSRILFTVHDSVVGQCSKAKKLDVLSLVEEQMQQPIPELGGVSIPVEIKSGPSWGEGKRFDSTERAGTVGVV